MSFAIPRLGRRPKKTKKYWQNCDIPARLFFNILDEKNIKLLIKDTPENEGLKAPAEIELTKAWGDIYDEVYLLKDDRKLKLILETQKTILQLHLKIEAVKPVLWALAKIELTKEQLLIIVTELNKQGVGINAEKPILEEVLKALNVFIGGTKTRMAIEQDNLKNLTTEGISTFESNCVKFEQYGFNISENVSLRKYIAYEKAAYEKAKQTIRTKKR